MAYKTNNKVTDLPGQNSSAQRPTSKIHPKIFKEEMNLFSGAFNSYKFEEKRENKLSEELPQIDVKPLDIVEPQLLGKSSLMGKSSTVSVNTQENTPQNDFQPKKISKTISDHGLTGKNIIEDLPEKTSLPIQDDLLKIETPQKKITLKTIFRGKHIPIELFEENFRTVKVTWITAKVNSHQPQTTKYLVLSYIFISWLKLLQISHSEDLISQEKYHQV